MNVSRSPYESEVSSQEPVIENPKIGDEILTFDLNFR